MNKFKILQDCIGCSACVEVASDFFEMSDNKKAILKKQPKNNSEESICEEASHICPVEAIKVISEDDIKNTKNNTAPILSSAKVKETLDKYPELKKILTNLSPKFKRMQNPVLYNTLARFADFNDASKVTGVSVCEILHVINEYLGVEDKLLKSMPECINKKNNNAIEDKSVPITWDESPERYIYNHDTINELVQKISNLQPKESIVIFAIEKPHELLKVADGLGFSFNIEKFKEYRISIFNPTKPENKKSWQEIKDNFEILDVRSMTTDPFDIIIKKAYDINDDSGFILIQQFEPHPMINMLSEMGYEHETVQKSPNEFWIYFHKKVNKDVKETSSSEKIDVVIQSATPVAYPVIMRLLQSEKIRQNINIKELKVWEETEKHLAWITQGKADISFSALITSAKLKNSDIKIPALFVWDNFVLLSRKNVTSFEDIKGTEIYTPLFEEAPPAKITRYLIKASGLNPDNFKLIFGKPFGRPEEIYADFITGKAQTVILREPEASYAIKIMSDRNEDISVLSFNKIWNDINPGFGSFPNAGLVLKGDFVRKYPEQTKLFIEELKSAIEWVNNNKQKSAELSFDMMRQPVDRVRLFLDRVNFNYVDGEKLTYKVKQYFDILNKNGVVNMKLDNDFMNIFKMPKS